MSFSEQIDALKTRHRGLEQQIDQEISRPLPNMDMIHDLKRQKLRIKDQIAALEATTH